MALSILLVEDEFSIAMDLKVRLQKMGYEVAGIALSYETAMQKIMEQKPGLILMDINLGKDRDGISIAATVYKNFRIPVIFVTAFSDKDTIARAMNVMPFGYLIKPFKDVDIDNAVRLAMQHYQELQDKQVELDYLKSQANNTSTMADDPGIFIRHKGQLEKVLINDIILLEALDNYTAVHTQQQKYTVAGLLKELHSQLPPEKFIRVHKSYVVNAAAVKSIDDNMLLLSNNLSTPLSKSYRADFFNRIKVLH